MTDIWALGILLYELFHGYAPYRGNRMDIVALQVQKGKYDILPKIQSNIKTLIQ